MNIPAWARAVAIGFAVMISFSVVMAWQTSKRMSIEESRTAY